MKILGINPWIFDFAAYDFWLKPYGFLVLLTYLKNEGIKVNYIDCLDKKKTCDNFGRGKYYSDIIHKPEKLNFIPRYFKRYGVTPEEFLQQLEKQRPDMVLVTSSMTYWYLGICEVEKLVKRIYPSIPFVLGGLYPTLVFEHAKNTFPSAYIFPTEKIKDFFSMIDIKFDPTRFYSTLPDYDCFYSHIDYVVFRTSWGCPFNCKFCAIKKLFPNFFRIPTSEVIDFLIKYYEKGIKNFVLYDDAFLYPPQTAKEILKEIDRANIKANFHTPNALHLRFLDEEIAYLLKKVGFINPHFGLETLNPKLQKDWGGKVNKKDLIRGVKYLKKAGYREGEFSIYLLLGFPGQKLEILKKEIDYIHSLGAKVSLAEFSPVPGTEIFHKYEEELKEPLLHNNSIFYFLKGKLEEIYELKNYTRQLNKKFT